MVWKSREEKLPPPSYFSLIVAYLQRSYRGARISREMMVALRPFFIEAWRSGKNAEAAAQSTCSCDGREIVPSPVVGVHIAKGSVRAPKGAQRGDVFGADELRAPAPVERLEKRLRHIERKQQKEAATRSRWQQQAELARREGVRKEAGQRAGAATQRHADLKAEAERIEAELRRVRSELARVGQAGHVMQSGEAASPADPPAPTVATASTTTRKRGRPAQVSGPAEPAKEEQAQAMLSALRGLLPDVAGQLAAQMQKESGKK